MEIGNGKWYVEIEMGNGKIVFEIVQAEWTKENGVRVPRGGGAVCLGRSAD
jgi:hypothetical protein